MLKKTVAVAASLASILALSAGAAAAYGSKSTKLSHGVLTVMTQNGCEVSGNCSLYYAATTYEKTNGPTVSIQLALDTGESLYKTDAMQISAGQTKTKSWGGLAKSKVPDCTVAGYMVATTGKYYTPNVGAC
ncbi:hypothetical protein ACIO3O_28565 [Streptomyces sp. NPDC087440]|uniref:hypothetical protein n=1 Tax=Streptomyces sp. NPDC087440 TaxID=3365790 RepID=UPI0037F441A5